MKKLSLILIILSISFLTFYGCSKAEVEKHPVTLTEENNKDITRPEDDASEDTALSEEPSSVDDKTNEENTTELSDDPSADKGNDNTSKAEGKPQKYTIILEGMEEEFSGRIYKSRLGYQMVYDIERFNQIGHTEDADIYMTENLNPELYPFVYLIVRTVSDEEINNDLLYFNGVTTEPNTDGRIPVEESEKEVDNVMIGDYEAEHYILRTGNEWNSPVRNLYVIKTESNTFAIETQYFVEAEEGYGARMKAMLDTFKIIE
ncbi:hypothetical protein I5677_11070 [Mobilitalea sibirica]|uniref:Uncharacterized protein n=1 Tax=Mobilitalea sibirica TaxID=1462919 RepID=A0A8J7L020_9FIRM|nr:hypothetical protein [Mobilitalea sibirica]MBH1941433.1 hypothetical protein [Mobilitalea sibirica]